MTMPRIALSFVLAITCLCAAACNRSEEAPEIAPAPPPVTVSSTPAPGPSGATTVTAATEAPATAAPPVIVTPPPSHAAAPPPSHDAHPVVGGVGTCSATQLDGTLIGLETAPTSRSGYSHDYVACRAKLEPRIKAAVCAGKTSGSGSYLYKIGASPATKSAILCK
jgi:hypothetical protein